MKKLLSSSLLCLFFYPVLMAQDKDSVIQEAFDISGYGGVYYKYNFNKNTTDNKTSFTKAHNSFELGMLSLKIQNSFGKVSLTGDVGFGKRADAFSYNDKKSSVMLKQLYIDYKPTTWLKLTAGSFATYIGYELVDANLNRNYSMSYLFSFGPFFHTGVKASATTGNHTIMLGVFNPTDYKYAPLKSKKYIGGQWKFHPKDLPFSSTLSYIGGEDTAGLRKDQIDIVLTYTLSSHFNIAYNGSYNHYSRATDADWWGSALYLNIDCTETLGFTLRTEYFNDADGLTVFTNPTTFPDGGNIWSFTCSANYNIGALTLIPEIRMDHADAPLFMKGKKAKNNSTNILMALVYSF